MDEQGTRQQDLSKLISQAESVTEKQTAARSIDHSRTTSRTVPVVLAGVLAIGLVYTAHSFRAHWGPPNDARVVHDLGVAIDAAKTLVDNVKLDTGALPDALPNASLAAVVRYQPRETDYRLSASAMGVRVTLEWDGTRKTEIGAE